MPLSTACDIPRKFNRFILDTGFNPRTRGGRLGDSKAQTYHGAHPGGGKSGCATGAGGASDDEIGTLNFTTPEDIVDAARLVRKGRVFSLALAFDANGPQGGKSNYPAMGRFNPIHLMLRTGTDAYSGVLDHRGIRGADDVIIMPLQAGTQWDGLAHIFYEDRMYNGYDCRLVTTGGAARNGIEKTRDKMVGRGVLLDVARAKGQRVAQGRLRHHQPRP